MEIAALTISIIALIFSAIQFFSENSRLKKEATLTAYNALQDDVFAQIKTIDISNLEKGMPKWDEMTICLAKIENFSVGINTGIYSLPVLNRLGGNSMIEKFNELKPIIDKKRGCSNGGKHYDEYEEMIRKLEKERTKKR